MLLITIILVACSSGNTTPSPENSELDEADEFAEEMLEALVDHDIAKLYENMTDEAIENKSTPMVGITEFIELTENEILQERAADKNRYNDITEDQDYFFGAYDGFYEDKLRVLYLAKLYNPYVNDVYNIFTDREGDRVLYRFEIVLEDDEWKLDGVTGWKKSTVKDHTSDYMELIYSEDDHVRVLHDGEDR